MRPGGGTGAGAATARVDLFNWAAFAVHNAIAVIVQAVTVFQCSGVYGGIGIIAVATLRGVERRCMTVIDHPCRVSEAVAIAVFIPAR